MSQIDFALPEDRTKGSDVLPNEIFGRTLFFSQRTINLLIKELLKTLFLHMPITLI